MPDNNHTQHGILGYELKTPESKKNKEWYKRIMENIIPYDNSVSEKYMKLRKLYAFMNNDLSVIKKELDTLCKPLGDLFDFGDLDEQVVAYNRVFPKYNYHLGQLSKYGDNLEIMRLSDSGNDLWNKELRDTIQKSVDEKIKLMFEIADMEMAGATGQEMQEYYEKMRSYAEPQDIDTTNFASSVERFNAKIVDYFRFKFNLNHMKKEAFKHVLIADECWIGVLEVDGKPHPVILNPLHFGYHKSPDTEYVQNGDYWWYRIPITVSQAYSEVHDEVPEEDLAKILSYGGASNLRPTPKWDVTKPGAEVTRDYTSFDMLYDNDHRATKEIGQHMDIHSDVRHRANARYIWKVFLQFIAYREVYFLTYLNDYNREVTEVVPSNYPIPEDATTRRVRNRYGKMVDRKEWVDETHGPMYIDRMWIPRKYQCTRYGSDIFTNFRESPNQPVNVEDPFDIELDAKGKTFSSLNSQGISLIERALPSALQYIFVKNLQNKELSKYEGYIKNIDASQIPDYIAQDENGEPLYDGVDKLAIWRYYRKKLGDSYTDSTLMSNGFQNYTRSQPVIAEQAGQIAEIVNMQNLLELIDREMGLQMLVPPQAEGVFQPYSNATDNQNALMQGYTMAEEMYAQYNEIWRYVVNEYLRQFRSYYRKFFEENPNAQSTSLNYVTATGTKEIVEITPHVLDHEDIGVFVRETGYAARYREYMMTQLQAFAQNAGEGVETVSSLVMAIARGESPEEIHKSIVLATKKQQERMQEIQRMQEEAQQRVLATQRQIEREKDERDHQQELEVIDKEAAHDKEIKALDIYKFTEDKNQDQDGVPDPIEAMVAVRQLEQKDRELDIKEKEAQAKIKQAKKTNK